MKQKLLLSILFLACSWGLFSQNFNKKAVPFNISNIVESSTGSYIALDEQGNIHRSLDSGTTWSSVLSDSTLSYVSAFSNGDLWGIHATDSITYVHHSTDDGQNWNLSDTLAVERLAVFHTSDFGFSASSHFLPTFDTTQYFSISYHYDAPTNVDIDTSQYGTYYYGDPSSGNYGAFVISYPWYKTCGLVRMGASSSMNVTVSNQDAGYSVWAYDLANNQSLGSHWDAYYNAAQPTDFNDAAISPFGNHYFFSIQKGYQPNPNVTITLGGSFPNESYTSHKLNYLVGYFYGALGVNKMDQEWVIIDSLGYLTYVPDPQVSSITGSSCLSSGQSILWSPTHLYLIDYSNSISVEENSKENLSEKSKLQFATGGKINVITDEDWTLRVLSLDGKLVFEESGSGSTTEIQLPQLPYQPFLISLETENHVRHYKYLYR